MERMLYTDRRTGIYDAHFETNRWGKPLLSAGIDLIS